MREPIESWDIYVECIDWDTHELGKDIDDSGLWCLKSEVRALEKDYAELERKLKIAVGKIEFIRDNIGYPSIMIDLANEALSAIREE